MKIVFGSALLLLLVTAHAQSSDVTPPSDRWVDEVMKPTSDASNPPVLPGATSPGSLKDLFKTNDN